ncbi:hypothetical protein RHGRI_005782 [Rhododendron griersonianum]|uniref:Uncharacterized protein n=1 Tax=Rhododendron griersonianum TaxID=479676 RepID=A0AAV6LG51_9ERIC|nr:hypothetical protein RHGRI_005782 [Rhododendron griersonianum]
MVEIHDGERPSQAVGGKGVAGLDDPSPSKPRSRRPIERDYSSRATLSDEISAVLRSDPQARGDVRDHLSRPKENPRFEVPEESSGSFYNLAYTASHETAVDQQRERRYREHDQCAWRPDRDRDRYYRRERSPSRDYRERRHLEEVYERRPAWVTDPLLEI